MKIGVITWFKYNNYGTKLQAFAMQEYLRKSGHNPELVNFNIVDSKSKSNTGKNLYDFIGRVLRKMVKTFYHKQFSQKEINMSKFISDNCNISDLVNTDEEYISLCNKYDCLIFGSDQIWNPNWFHSYYYANFNSIKTKKIAYAPSIGVKSIPDNMKKQYSEVLNSFSNIAMREKNGRNEISKLIDKKVNEVLDPVFLLNREEWEKYLSKDNCISKPFILCYMLTDNKKHWRAIKKYCKDKNKELVVIPIGGHSYFASKNVMNCCDIGMFLKLFKNCDEVITDSFHGTSFSILYNKNFTVFERHNPNLSSSENDRICNILKLFGLENRMVHYNSEVISNSDSINYKLVNDILNNKIKESKDYLRKSIGENK